MSILTIDKMSNAELVALVIGKAASNDECVRLAACIAGEGSFADMLYFPSTPARKARLDKMLASIELGKRNIMSKREPRLMVSTPEQVISLMTPVYHDESREVFYALCLNTKNQLIKMVEISIGSLNASIVHPRELYKTAVRYSAASIIVVHNHPSGDPTPSGADLQLTRRLAKAGEVLGIELLDHIVMGGEGRYTSLREQGVL